MSNLADITSYSYLVFVFICLLIYWHISKKYQWIILLSGSIAFYLMAASIYTLPYVIVSVFSVYIATVYFDRAIDSKMRKRCFLLVVIVVNIVILVMLKYTNEDGKLLVPLAISFYTFQLLAYLLDSYWGVIKPERNILKLFLYTIYFSLMISGPICRCEELGTQLTEGFEFDYGMVSGGVRRIAWGLLKKMVVANRLVIIVDILWQNVTIYSGLFVWLSAFLYVLELYMDFSGCIDIISGVSLCFGIRLPENFKSPLFSKTVQEIWQRWHITLGAWAKNYIMYPLQKSEGMILFQSKLKDSLGKKVAKKITAYISMLAVWLFVGIWHGRSWKYILGEGLWFWVVIVLEDLLPAYQGKLKAWKIVQIVRTYILFSIGMIAFHANSFMDYLHRLGRGFMVVDDFRLRAHDFLYFFISPEIGGIAGLAMMVIAVFMVGLVDYQSYMEKEICKEFCFSKYPVFGQLAMVFIVTFILFSVNIAAQEFIYAQF